MKNESMNIDEWVMHYQQVGAQRIYLIDNGSTDDTVAKAKAWVDKGVVELIERPVKHRQIQHYWDAIETFKIRKTCRWLLIADLDEFWFCPGGESLPVRLEAFGGIDVIYSNFRSFGSSGLINHPGSIRQNLIHCESKLDHHYHKKYLCRTSAIKSSKSIDVHKVKNADSGKTVSDNHDLNLFHYTPSPTCLIPDVCIDERRLPLLIARATLRDLIAGLEARATGGAAR